ncbi:MAG: sugar phosphate isomerase/epimerase [Clostridia bacterium]|nr:sugar phosphate isomerase/epimerase [Clostridia bacterium]
MNIGFCNKFLPDLDLASLNEAGFECLSFCLRPNYDAGYAKFARELCFYYSDEKDFYDAAQISSDCGVNRLVIGEDFAFRNAKMLLSLPKMPFDIAIENKRTCEKAILDFFEETKGSENRFGLCLNTGHSVLFGREAHEVLSLFGERIFSIHINDNHRTGDYHLPPFRGRGGVDFEKFASVLSKIGYDGEIYLDVRLPDISSDNVMEKSLRVLYLIAKEITENCI